MKIRTALTLKNTLATAAVFLACLAAVYLVSEHTRSRTFYHTCLLYTSPSPRD